MFFPCCRQQESQFDDVSRVLRLQPEDTSHEATSPSTNTEARTLGVLTICEKPLILSVDQLSSLGIYKRIKGSVSKETVVQHRWGSGTQKIGMNGLIRFKLPRVKGYGAEIWSVSTSERIEELWVVCGLYRAWRSDAIGVKMLV